MCSSDLGSGGAAGLGAGGAALDSMIKIPGLGGIMGFKGFKIGRASCRERV